MNAWFTRIVVAVSVVSAFVACWMLNQVAALIAATIVLLSVFAALVRGSMDDRK